MAIRIEELKDTGIQATDCRWMLIGGLVEHYTETTYPGDKARSFESADAILSTNSCFMLTQKGTEFVAEFLVAQSANADTNTILGLQIHQPKSSSNRNSTAASETNRTKLGCTTAGTLVRQQARKAVPNSLSNQVAILAAFEERAGPRASMTAPQHYEIDPRRRLNDTIRNLNRSRINLLIRFSGDRVRPGNPLGAGGWCFSFLVASAVVFIDETEASIFCHAT